MFTVRVTFILFAVAAMAAGEHMCQSPTAPEETQSGLERVKRICVQAFSGDERLSESAREVAIAALFGSKRFAVTENCERADAIMKGAILEKDERRERGESEAVQFGVAAGGASVSGSSGSGAFGAAGGGSGQALYSSETRSHATVTLRLVDNDGEVIWAHSQNSPGGKTKSALVDAVDRAVNQLLKEADRAGRQSSAQ
jgi:hypothetical protein